MSTNRYRVVVAMLDDLVTRAAVTRELIRRGKHKLLPPPIPVREGGEMCGWVFPTMRQAMVKFHEEIRPGEVVGIDVVLQIFSDGDHWFVLLILDEGSELGPFDSLAKALAEAETWLRAEGHTILKILPWDEEDLEAYAVGI